MNGANREVEIEDHAVVDCKANLSAQALRHGESERESERERERARERESEREREREEKERAQQEC